MNAPVSIRVRDKKGGAITDLVGTVASLKPVESSLPFGMFLLYMVSFYLHFGERFPAIAPMRPDLTIIALVALATFPYLRDKADLTRLPVAKALNWLVLWIVISLPFVEWPGSVLRDNWYPFVKAILFFYFTVMLVDTPRRLKWFVFVFLACQVFRVLEPLYLNVTEGYLGSETHLGGGEFVGRLSGAPSDVISANGLGFLVVTALIFMHFLLWQAPGRIAKLTYLALVPPMLYTLILTMSRTGFLILLVGGWMVFRQSNRKAVLVLAAILTGAVGWSVMTDVQKDRYLSLVTADARQSATRQGRIDGTITEFRLGLNSPVFGHGLGTTPEAKVNVLGSRAQAAHDTYAELIIEVGLPGLALFLTFIWRIGQVVRENLRWLEGQRKLNDTYKYFERLNRALLAAFWVYLVFSFAAGGLSQDYWYVLGGGCVAFGLIIQRLATVDVLRHEGARK